MIVVTFAVKNHMKKENHMNLALALAQAFPSVALEI